MSDAKVNESVAAVDELLEALEEGIASLRGKNLELSIQVKSLTAERDALKADNDKLNDALNIIGEKEFANSGYNLPQMVRLIDQLVTLRAQVEASPSRQPSSTPLQSMQDKRARH